MDVELCVLHFDHFGFRREQFGRFVVEFGKLFGRAEVGFAGNQDVADADLVFVQGLLGVVGVDELARIDHGEDGGYFEPVGEGGGFEFVDDTGGVRQAAGFYHDAVGFVAQQFGQRAAHLRPGGAAEAAAGDFGHGDAFVAQNCAVDADFAEFVD